MKISALLPVCEEISEEDARRHCERNIQSYWRYLAPSLYNLNLNTELVYQRICGSDLGSDACQTCQLRVSLLAEMMQGEEMVANMTRQVQGDLFCDMEGAWWDVAECQAGLPLSIFPQNKNIQNIILIIIRKNIQIHGTRENGSG